MRKISTFSLATFVFSAQMAIAQGPMQQPEKLQPIVESIVNEVNNNSQLEVLATELLDGIGPRLVGTPGMQQANDWAVDKMKSWGIDAYNQQYGTWKGWERGITHVDMTYPRVKSLTSMQLAWSPATKKPVEAEVVILPNVANKAAFDQWLPSVKGKIVLVAQRQ